MAARRSKTRFKSKLQKGATMHNLVVRGPIADLWQKFQDDPGSVPQEVALWGEAGASKSWSILTMLLWLPHRYPNVPGRMLICRDTYKSLVRSACVTIRKILPRGHPALEGPGDEHREEYTIGAWTITLSGLSEPSRLYSTEWDIVFVEEGREIGLRTWEEFGRGSRNFALYRYAEDGSLARDEFGNLLDPNKPSAIDVPFSLTILATNPDAKNHWIRMRGLSGKMAFLQSTIHDNPAYWDAEKDEVTVMGAAYRARMSKLTGVTYRRLVLAEWCSAEGAVWLEWDPELHVLRGARAVKKDDEGWVLRSEIERLGIVEFYAGIDLGYDNAGVAVIGGYTKDRKIVILAELFHSHMSLAWWSEWIVKIHKHYPLTLAFCDHNRPDWITAWNDAVGAPSDGPGAIFIRADKGVDRGLEIVRRRLSSRDGPPTLHFVHDSLLHLPDADLMERHVPWQTVDCIPGYVYKRSSYSDDKIDDTASRPDKPDKSKATSDGADALRYLCVGLEYFEPDEGNGLKKKSKYREMLRWIHKRTTGVELAEDDEIPDIDEEDWIVDTIVQGLGP